jgi:putative zinc finger/helix-turn-helix YgiT family protein
LEDELMATCCYVCGADALTDKLEDIPYRALPGTTILQVKVEQCTQCGERFEHIPAMTQLEDALARALLSKQARLTGHEIRFLRKYLGQSGVGMARKMRVTKETMSRWQTGARAISPQNDLLLRLIVAAKMGLAGYQEELESVATGDPAPLSSRVVWAADAWSVAA